MSDLVIEEKPPLPVEGWMPPQLDREFTIIGKSLNRRDAREKVNGKARYAYDINVDGMLHAKILRCPHSRARIKRIDTSQAESLPGVRAVISVLNCSEWYTEWYMVRQPAFTREIAYAGQEVAAVAADTVEAASRALELIQVDYEVLPAVFDPEEAMGLKAPLVPILDVDANETRSGNVHSIDVYQRGDVRRGFDQADVITEGDFSLPGQFHADIGTRCCVAVWDGDRLTVHESSQGVWNLKLQLAKSLGLPDEKVRVVVKYQAGGFGSKAGAQRFVHYASKLAMMTKSAVRLELNRREEFLSHPRRYGARVRLRIGAKKDGTITAIEERCVVDLGVGSLYSKGASRSLIHHLGEAYKCENMHVQTIGVYTNTIPTGPQRGVLNPVGVFPLECAIDDLARKLGMDPADLRVRNYVEYADERVKMSYSSKRLDQCIREVTRAIGWKHREEIARANEHSTKKRGIGMVCFVFQRAGYKPNKALAQVAISKDGRVQLRAGFVDIGTGSATILPMIAAEELGVELDQVDAYYGDTDGTLYSPSSHASRVTQELGPAVLQAAAMAREELFGHVGRKFGVKPEALSSANGRVYTRARPELSISFKDACGSLPEEGILKTGSRAPNSDREVYRQFGAQAAEVEVDVETGEVKVLRMVSSYDIGRALNPKLVRSQMYGGITMGLGMALLEDHEFDDKSGILLNCDIHQYRIPSSLEIPEIETLDIEGKDIHYPYSGKPVGEAPLMGAIPAIRNAVLHATGMGINALPITPDKILDGLGE